MFEYIVIILFEILRGSLSRAYYVFGAKFIGRGHATRDRQGG